VTTKVAALVEVVVAWGDLKPKDLAVTVSALIVVTKLSMKLVNPASNRNARNVGHPWYVNNGS
jgi:hypothetical protein